MLIIGCSHAREFAKKVARRLKKPYSELHIEKFPDSELHLRFKHDVRGKTIVLVQSFYNSKDYNIDDNVMEVIFAASTAIELGAKKIILAAPYFPYFRQDKRFKPGACVSIRVIGGLFNKLFDQLLTIDPHLHRIHSMSDVFNIHAKHLTSNKLLAKYIKNNIRNPVIIGPDEESFQWARRIAESIKIDAAILKKRRYSAREVKVTLNKKIDLKNKNLVIIDDIISTGHTILETIKDMKRLRPRRIYCICIHGIFAENALEKIEKHATVISTNTIPNKVAKIDVSDLIADEL